MSQFAHTSYSCISWMQDLSYDVGWIVFLWQLNQFVHETLTFTTEKSIRLGQARQTDLNSPLIT